MNGKQWPLNQKQRTAANQIHNGRLSRNSGQVTDFMIDRDSDFSRWLTVAWSALIGHCFAGWNGFVANCQCISFLLATVCHWLKLSWKSLHICSIQRALFSFCSSNTSFSVCIINTGSSLVRTMLRSGRESVWSMHPACRCSWQTAATFSRLVNSCLRIMVNRWRTITGKALFWALHRTEFRLQDFLKSLPKVSGL